MRLFIFGLGYTAGRLEHTAATTRTGAGDTLAFDGAAPAALDLRGVTHVLSSVPPDTGDDPVLRHHAEDLARAPGLEHITYLSTTGVYGDSGGAWVDEDAPTDPNNERRARRVRDELAWRAVGKPLCVLRLAGIYGPGRSVFDQLREGHGRRIHKPDKVFNRVHVDDIAQVARAAMVQRATGVFNVADGQPCSQREPVELAASLLGIEPPPLQNYEDVEMSAMMRSFYAGNTRVRADKIREELGVQLAHPDVLSGLRAIFAATR